MVELFQFFRWHRGRSIDINFLLKKGFASWLTNERFAMTHHPVGCFDEISLKLKPFREVQKGCGTSHDSKVLGIIQCFYFPHQSS